MREERDRGVGKRERLCICVSRVNTATQEKHVAYQPLNQLIINMKFLSKG